MIEMNKQFWCVVGFFLVAGGLYALDAWNIGTGAELNANSREGVAAGGGLLFGLELNKRFTAGIKASFFSNMDTVNTMEGQALLRYYLFFPIDGFFVQADAGASVFFEQGESFPAFLGGLSGGWRFLPGKLWYFEPTLRLGYPFIWGIGIGGGVRLEMGGTR
jgi:hypothetical protein